MIFVLLLGIMPAASADYMSLNSAVAGERLDMIIKQNEYSSVACTDGSIPNGCVIETEIRDGVYHHYLRGTPMYAGDYSFTLTFSNDGISSGATTVCSLTIVAANPTVSMPDNIRCYEGDQVQIDLRATVADYGTLSYQWYYNNYNSNHDGTLIKDETSSIYKPSTSATGTTYYYCEVTNTNKGSTSTFISATVAVTVEEAAVSYISVSTLPKRTEYTVGDWLDAAGMKLHVVYTNGRTEDIDAGFGLYPTELTDAGTINITVDYKGKECTFPVTVKEDEKKIENMSIISKPTKLEYNVGDTLDTTGLKLRVSYAGGKTEDVTTGFTCTPTTLSKEGTQAITVTYGGKSTSFTVKVSKANDDVQSITIAVQPTKLTYKVGESLDTTGMKLTVRTGSETKDITTGFTCTPTSFTKAGEYEIKVTYGGKKTTFKVSVTEDASASPEASATPTVSPTPSSEPQPVAKKSNALLIVGIIAAILALAALGAYVYVMNRGKSGGRRRR